MNSVIISGRLTKDPNISYTQSQMAIARFNLAVSRGKDKEGNEQTDFPSCVAFGKTAELIEKYVSKGSKVLVQGRIQTGSYEKDGRKVYTTDVAVDRIEFLDSKGSKTEDKPVKAEQGTIEDFPFTDTEDKPIKAEQGAIEGFSFTDEDIPF